MGCGSSTQTLENVILPSEGRYERKQLIGVGHHGRVYRCLYHLDHQEYALKVIDQLENIANFEQRRQTWTQTAKQLTNLSNQHTIAYKQIEFNQREISVIMHLSKQGTLRKYVQKNSKLTEQKAANIIQSILEGLLFLHRLGIFHKDLKTNNILLFGEEIKLSDYMLAELYDFRLSESTINKKEKVVFNRGDSLPFIAPEVIRNEGFSQKSDSWSVGCILVEMLTGKAPWSNFGGTFQEAFKKITLGSHPSFPTNISKDCENFLSACLSISPIQRLSIKELLKHKFIRTFSKKTTQQYETEDKQIKIQKTDKSKRVNSRNSKKYEQPLKPPHQSHTNNQINENHINSQSSARRKLISKREDTSSMKKDQSQDISKEEKLTRLKEVVNSLSKVGNNSAVLSKDEILPQILEDQQQTVILNNKKVRVHALKNIKAKLKTQQNDSHNHSIIRNQKYSSSQLQDTHPNTIKHTNNSFRISTKNTAFQDTEPNQQANDHKIDTEPSIIISEFQPENKDFFKRPLKLLKKKLQDRKVSSKGYTNATSSENSQSFTNGDVMKVYIEDQGNNNTRNRSITESSRQETVINTQLAKAERDRYINQQLNIKKQREEDKKKWEQQLKKDGDIIKKQFSHRYGQPHALLIASLQK